MAFNKSFLTSHGVPEDQVEAILSERSRTLNDYVPKADIQAQIDAAVAAAKTATPDIKTAPEYVQLLAENQKIKAFGTDEFAPVKVPYRDIVWDKLDHTEKHKPYAEQITELATTMPDLFQTQEQPEKPHFGAPTQGQMPSGKEGPSFMDGWGFVPKK